MLARLAWSLSFLLASGSTLPNGIRVYEFDSDRNAVSSIEVLVGYRTGVRNETAGTRGLAAVVSAFLRSTPSARAMAVAAYGAGGEVEYFSDIERTGLRLKMPAWARPMLEDSVAAFLSETPQKNASLVERAIAEVRIQAAMSASNGANASDVVRSSIEDQFRTAVLGVGTKDDLSGITRTAVEQYFATNYGTDRAFVVMSGASGEGGASAKSLQAVDLRRSAVSTDEIKIPAKPGTALRIQSDLQEGAVILGVPTPSVYYRSWYGFLMLDRLIHEVLAEKPRTELTPTLDPYYYRLEVPVSFDQTAAAVESALRQELDRLQYVRAPGEQLEKARQSALQYLNSEAVERWYLSLGIPERRVEGLEWVRSFSADDMRAVARDIVESNPVTASWSPKPRVLRLEVESLNSPLAPAGAPKATGLSPLGSMQITPFPKHTDVTEPEQPPVRLASGVSVVASSAYAVFVAPGLFKTYEAEPSMESIQSAYGGYRANRILVMVPAASLDRVSRQWAGFQGNPNDDASTALTGKITSADIPALFVLKMLLDRSLIEAGLWSDVRLNIRAASGATLTIQASDADRRLVLGWIADIAARAPDAVEMDWAREAAIHHLSDARADLQSLVWQWNPEGMLGDIRTIPASQIQDVARIYLQ